MGVRSSATGGLQVALHDHDSEELVRPLNVQITIYQEDTLPLRIVERNRPGDVRSEEHTSELQSLAYLVCRLLLEKKKRSVKRRAPLVCLAYHLATMLIWL